MTQKEIMARVGCGQNMVKLVVRRFDRPPRRRCDLRLSFQEREEIAVGLAKGDSMRCIGMLLGRDPATISREAGGQLKGAYRASRGEELAEQKSHRKRPRKLKLNVELRNAVEAGLAKHWSPEQISKRLKLEHPDNPEMQVSHETIYRALYVRGRGLLRKDLASYLREGTRTRRRPLSRSQKSGHLQGMVNISQRPAEADDRAVPGHWEGDLIKGALNRSCIGTLVERTTRFVMLLHLPNGGGALHVRDVLIEQIRLLPEELRRSLTWDQGGEMAHHAQFTVDTGMDVYFCDPHAPWQRGSNENTNGLLRQYFPKGIDLSVFDKTRLDEVARELNGRPRETLGWRTPAEKLNELLLSKSAA